MMEAAVKKSTEMLMMPFMRFARAFSPFNLFHRHN